MAKLVDALDLGSSTARCESSSLSIRTTFLKLLKIKISGSLKSLYYSNSYEKCFKIHFCMVVRLYFVYCDDARFVQFPQILATLCSCCKKCCGLSILHNRCGVIGNHFNFVFSHADWFFYSEFAVFFIKNGAGSSCFLFLFDSHAILF